MAVQWQRWGSTIHFIWNDTMIDRDRLAAMPIALDASPRTLRRPVCHGWLGDWQITGRHGDVQAFDGGFLIYFQSEGSPRRWTNAKALLSFAELRQDAEDEGIVGLDRLPTSAEAAVIRKVIGIRRRRHLSADEKADLARRLSRFPQERAIPAQLSV
jgi:hypothetical protein